MPCYGTSPTSRLWTEIPIPRLDRATASKARLRLSPGKTKIILSASLRPPRVDRVQPLEPLLHPLTDRLPGRQLAAARATMPRIPPRRIDNPSTSKGFNHVRVVGMYFARYRSGEEASMKSTTCLTSMVALLVAGCASVAFEPRPSVGPPGGRGAQALGIPPGHLPPPGECRIWIPGRPPGQQAPPGPCDALRRRVPPGSWLISSPAAAPDQVRVAVYDDRRPRVVVAIRLYDTATGRFLRAEEP